MANGDDPRRRIVAQAQIASPAALAAVRAPGSSSASARPTTGSGLRSRTSHAPRGPLGARRAHVARLLPRQHRPQGHRDPVHGHLVLLPARSAACWPCSSAPSWPSLGHAVPHPEQAYNGVPQRPRHRAHLPVRHPGVRRAWPTSVPAAHDRCPGHGVPAAERPVVLDAADWRASSWSDRAWRLGGSFAAGWTAYAPLSTTMPLGQLFFTIAVQFAGASSIATALNLLVTITTMRAPGMSFFRIAVASCGRTSQPCCWS